MRQLLFIAVVAALGLLYFHGLGSPRIYLSVEEVLQALQAHSVATNGRDLTGRWLPLYPAEPWYEAGRDPLWVYATAVLLNLFPFSEALIRVPSAVAGVANVILMYLVAKQLFRRTDVAVAAAIFLAASPAHFFQSRLATSQIGPVFFVLAWLLLLLKYLEFGNRGYLIASVALLGAGTYSYLSAVFLTPACFVLTLAVVVRTHGVVSRDVGVAVVAFGVALTPFIAWHIVHPERVGHLLGYYTANGYNTDLAAATPMSQRVVTRIDTWWEALNPAPLFFTGDGNLRFSTRYAGHLLLPTALFFVIGVATLRRTSLRGLRLVAVAGLLVAPLPALLATNAEIKRWLAFLPFAIVVAAQGMTVLLESRRRMVRLMVPLLVVAAVVQFSGYLRDYWSDYRERSYFFFGGDMGSAVRQALITPDDVRCVMVDKRVPILDHWLLYARVRGLHSVAAGPPMVDAASVSVPPAGCSRTGLLVHEHVIAEANGAEARLIANGWTKAPIEEPGGRRYLTFFWYTAR